MRGNSPPYADHARRCAWPVCAGAIYLLITACICSCNSRARSSYSEAQVAQVAKPGAPRSAIERAFGEPSATIPSKDGTVIKVYIAPEGPGVQVYSGKFVGFQVTYKSDLVVKWSPVYGDQTVGAASATPLNGGSERHQPAASKAGAEALAFYPLSDLRQDGLRPLNVPRLDLAGYTAPRPDLEVHTLDSVTSGATIVGAASQKPSLTIALDRDDAALLRNLTETNRGNRIVAMVGTNVLAAPRVYEPVRNGAFTITFQSTEERDWAKRLLQPLQRQ